MLYNILKIFLKLKNHPIFLIILKILKKFKKKSEFFTYHAFLLEFHKDP